MRTWLCTAMSGGIETTKSVDADDMLVAGALCSEWIASVNGTFVSMQLVDAARESGIAKLVDLGLTPEEAAAVAGG